ncbi:GIY-YIG nuclease family protein [Ferrovibrio xuzhouensis]|uniref:GIY-YIG nuclease family protein n=1 Tax=Ferrovibrio xuzhouensis TaxID=1576914 RepID=A0ABV7VG37_9PROT
MQGQDRRAAVAAYKEKKSRAGIYAVRCPPAGAVWIGQTLTLATVQNRLWFSLRMGQAPQAGLQAAWREHGPESLVFEVLEDLPEEALAYVRDRLLKDRLAHWRAALDAQAL